VAVVCNDRAVVVVEGKTRSARKFQVLMTRRIDWTNTSELSDSSSDEEDGGHEVTGEKCVKVWSGPMTKPKYRNFQYHQVFREKDAERIAGSFWTTS
jgi:hypothetical protein